MFGKDTKELFLAKKPEGSINDDEGQSKKNDEYDSESESVDTNEAIDDKDRILGTKNEKAVSYISASMVLQACTQASMRYTINEMKVNPIDYQVFTGICIALFPLAVGFANVAKKAANLDVGDQPEKPKFSKGDILIVFLRALFMIISGFCTTIANSILPMTIMMSMLNLSPMLSNLITGCMGTS